MIDPYNFTLINVSDSSNPCKILSFEPPSMGFYEDVFVEGSIIFLASAWGGIEIWQMNTTQSISIIQYFLYAILSSFGFSIVTIMVVITIRKKKKWI